MTRRGLRWASRLTVAIAMFSVSAVAHGAFVMPPDESAAPLPWHTDYADAYAAAKAQGKMLFAFFYKENDPTCWQFESRTLADAEIMRRLEQLIVVRLPLDAEIRVDGKPMRLLDHPAFQDMDRHEGFALIDLMHQSAPYYGHVVSAFPFPSGKFHTKRALKTVLDLPPGTITQRTMIYAVRTHPERPASAWGEFHPVLAEEAAQHSRHQAQIQLQGHHNWETRFHRINSRMPDGGPAVEVVAESWPGENLVEACVDCVNSWRQSPGHWGAVRARHRLFGYDIKRGGNGIWYATGTFSGQWRALRPGSPVAHRPCFSGPWSARGSGGERAGHGSFPCCPRAMPLRRQCYGCKSPRPHSAGPIAPLRQCRAAWLSLTHPTDVANWSTLVSRIARRRMTKCPVPSESRLAARGKDRYGRGPTSVICCGHVGDALRLC